MEKGTGKSEVGGKSKREPSQDRCGVEPRDTESPQVGRVVSRYGLGVENEKKGLGLPKTRSPEAEAEEQAAWDALYATLSKGERSKIASCPERYLKGYKRVLLGRASKTMTIKVGCQQCMGWTEIPEAIRDCTARACPKWLTRPYQQKKTVEVADNGGY